MNKTGCFTVFIIFLVIGGVCDCIDNGQKEEYAALEKRLMQYVDANDFKTAYQIMEKEGIDIKYVAIAEIDYMIKNKEYGFALNIAKDRLNDEGYYAKSVLENLVNIYQDGGEKNVIEAMLLINYPLPKNRYPKYWAGKNYLNYSAQWPTDGINELYAQNNMAIQKLLIQLDYENTKLSPSFKKTLASLLKPSVSYKGDQLTYNYEEANSIIRKFNLK